MDATVDWVWDPTRYRQKMHASPVWKRAEPAGSVHWLQVQQLLLGSASKHTVRTKHMPPRRLLCALTQRGRVQIWQILEHASHLVSSLSGFAPRSSSLQPDRMAGSKALGGLAAFFSVAQVIACGLRRGAKSATNRSVQARRCRRQAAGRRRPLTAASGPASNSRQLFGGGPPKPQDASMLQFKLTCTVATKTQQLSSLSPARPERGVGGRSFTCRPLMGSL